MGNKNGDREKPRSPFLFYASYSFTVSGAAPKEAKVASASSK